MGKIMTDELKLKYLKSRFYKYCINRCPAKDVDGEFRFYKRPDLYQWSKDAYERGDDCFYVEPVDPDKPHGELRLSDPIYEYEFDGNISEDMYKMLFEDE